MLDIENINFTHKNSTNGIKNISMSAKSGQITAILGPNGAGKTTLFRLVLGALKPQSGKIIVNNEDITDKEPKKRAKYTAYVPQEWQSPFRYSVLEVVMMGFASKMSIFKEPGDGEKDKAMSELESLGIAHLWNRGIDEISGGERQIALLARALVQESPVLLLDEPTSHLDLKNQMKVLCHLEALVQKKSIAALVTIHDPNLAAQFADYVVAIKKGEMFMGGSVAEVMNNEVLKGLYDTDVETMELCGRPIVRGKKGCLI